MPAGDYANTRYSPLDKINTGNVQNLHIAATMSTGIPHGHEGQPLVVNNTLYIVSRLPEQPDRLRHHETGHAAEVDFSSGA